MPYYNSLSNDVILNLAKREKIITQHFPWLKEKRILNSSLLMQKEDYHYPFKELNELVAIGTHFPEKDLPALYLNLYGAPILYFCVFLQAAKGVETDIVQAFNELARKALELRINISTISEVILYLGKKDNNMKSLLTILSKASESNKILQTILKCCFVKLSQEQLEIPVTLKDEIMRDLLPKIPETVRKQLNS